MERLILLLLALMLARIFFITVRLSYLRAQRPKSTDSNSRAQGELAAELCRKLRSLRSIFSTAPYIGLFGTCFGIVDTLSAPFAGSRGSALRGIVLGIHAAFLSTAAGILVAVPAICVHNYLRAWVESSEIESVRGRFRRTRFPLRPRLSTFSFQLTAVPVLAFSVAAFMIFPSFFGPRGLRVRLMPIGALKTRAPSLEPIVIAIVSAKAGVVPTVYVNSKKTTWDELQNRLKSELEVRPAHSMVYVQADKDIIWRDLMYVTDVAIGLHAEVVLTTKPDVHRPRGSSR
jgi:biopolymer transport protein ExbD